MSIRSKYTIKNYTIVDDIEFAYIEEKLPYIHVKMSGGVDSAMVMYTLAHLKQQQLIDKDTVFQAVTGVNWTRPYQEHFVNKTIDWINTQFEGDWEPIPPAMVDRIAKHETPEDGVNRLLDAEEKNKKLKVYYTGASRFLPEDYTVGTEWEHRKIPKGTKFNKLDMTYRQYLNPELPENPYHHPDEISRLWKQPHRDEIYHRRISPWENKHKGHVKAVSDYFGVTDQVLDVTRSCEYLESQDKQWMDWSEHCGECLWCAERVVTYNRY